MKIIFTLLYITSTIICGYSQPGTLDNTFGNSGKVTTSINSSSGGAAMAVQTDGKIIMAGYSVVSGIYHFALLRYNANGTPDSTFDEDGKVTTSFSATGDRASAIALQNDGKIVVAGQTVIQAFSNGFAVARYNIDGSLDTSFDNDGKQTTTITSGPNGATAVAIQNDGKIAVAGFSGNKPDFTLVRYNSNGSLDLTFNGTGIVITSIGLTDNIPYDIALQSDGKIILAGTSKSANSSGQGNREFTVARYNVDGTLDLSFDNDGKVVTAITSSDDLAFSVALQGDGKIIVGGHNNAHFLLARYNPNGSLDTNFDNDGKLIAQMTPYSDEGYSIVLQSDGKILMAGNFVSTGSNVLLARFNIDGSFDSNFNFDGKVTTPFGGATTIRSIKLFGNRIFAGGISDGKFAVAAYQNDGLPLPITLINFTASLDNYKVTCKWETVQELNASHFIIQRSFDGMQYKDVGRVDAFGQASKYVFKDVSLTETTEKRLIFYRLIMVDKDAKESLSSVAKISFEGSKLILIYPNPAHDYLMVAGKDLKEIKVMDASGRLVIVKNTGENTITRIKISGLGKGFYTSIIKDKHGAVKIKNFSIQ